MGASDSKLVFKQGIFKLSEQKDIPPDDSYWAGFWELPESSEDVFSLFSPTDIRRIRDDSLRNLETLILAVTSRLYALRHNPSFPHLEDAPERDALNCVRILTRLLPFIFEADHLGEWEDKFFWGRRRKRTKKGQQSAAEVLFDDSQTHETLTTAHETGFGELKPLAEELIETLIDLLFHSDFTLPKGPSTANKVTFAIWQSGVGCNTPVGTSKEYERNRLEILRLLLTLTSKSMYTSANALPVTGVKAITYMTTISDKQLVLTLLCSLLNTTLKYNPATWRVPYDHVVFKDPKQMFVTYCLQLLLVLVIYPVPDSVTGVPPKNYFRHFFGRIHRPQDFQFLVDGMTRILNQPLQATSSYLPGSQKSLTWASEMVMLFWELLQCNKCFRSFIVDTDRAHDFVVLVLFNAVQHKNDPSKQGIVRMCVFVLQTLSVEPNFGARLNKTFHGQETLPQSVRIPSFRGTYSDFLIISIYTLITASQGRLDAIYPALLAIINNIAPHVCELSPMASSKLIQLYATMSAPVFLFANESNHTLLQSLLEIINAIIENQYDKENAVFIYAIIRSQKRFLALREMTLDNGQERLGRHTQSCSELPEHADATNTPIQHGSVNGLRSPSTARAPSLSNVPEESDTFAIGDDDSSSSDVDTEIKPTPSHSNVHSPNTSRAPSIAETAVEDAVPIQVRGMSEKARGKLPANQSSFSRQNSSPSISNLALTPSFSNGGTFEPTAAWAATWLPDLPLHTPLTVIEQLTPHLPHLGPSSTTTPALTAIRRAPSITGLSPLPVRVHLFEWSPLSLGWYESLLWSFIFSAEMALAAGVSIWKGTNIRLFRVQESVAQGPSLLAPRGAVDAVGSNLVQRIGSLNLGAGLVGQQQQQQRSAQGQQQRNTRGGFVRDV